MERTRRIVLGASTKKLRAKIGEESLISGETGESTAKFKHRWMLLDSHVFG
jgi:hypothetical protein